MVKIPHGDFSYFCSLSFYGIRSGSSDNFHKLATLDAAALQLASFLQIQISWWQKKFMFL